LSSSSCGQSVFVRLEFYLARVNATEPTAAGTRSPTVKKAEAKKTAAAAGQRDADGEEDVYDESIE